MSLTAFNGFNFGKVQTQNAAGGGGAVGGWKELGRTTSGGGSTIDVSSLADKRYYMILSSIFADNDADLRMRVGNGSFDSGSNYASRWSENGAADGTFASSTSYIYNSIGSTYDRKFDVSYVSNYSTKEKLFISHGVGSNNGGASVAPKRDEAVGKWANTSNVIDRFRLYTEPTLNFASGDEMVVLGYDPADTHTTNFWTELTSKDFTGTADTVTTDTFTAKKYLWIQAYVQGTSSLRSGTIRFNGDTGANYAVRRNKNGGADDTFGSIDAIKPEGGAGGIKYFTNIFVINNAANEKLVIENFIEVVTTGAGTAPNRHEIVGKWANTSDQITSFSLYNDDSGDITSANIKVWGSN